MHNGSLPMVDAPCSQLSLANEEKKYGGKSSSSSTNGRKPQTVTWRQDPQAIKHEEQSIVAWSASDSCLGKERSTHCFGSNVERRSLILCTCVRHFPDHAFSDWITKTENCLDCDSRYISIYACIIACEPQVLQTTVWIVMHVLYFNFLISDEAFYMKWSCFWGTQYIHWVDGLRIYPSIQAMCMYCLTWGPVCPTLSDRLVSTLVRHSALRRLHVDDVFYEWCRLFVKRFYARWRSISNVLKIHNTRCLRDSPWRAADASVWLCFSVLSWHCAVVCTLDAQVYLKVGLELWIPIPLSWEQERTCRLCRFVSRRCLSFSFCSTRGQSKGRHAHMLALNCWLSFCPTLLCNRLKLISWFSILTKSHEC